MQDRVVFRTDRFEWDPPVDETGNDNPIADDVAVKLARDMARLDPDLAFDPDSVNWGSLHLTYRSTPYWMWAEWTPVPEAGQMNRWEVSFGTRTGCLGILRSHSSQAAGTAGLYRLLDRVLVDGPETYWEVSRVTR